MEGTLYKWCGPFQRWQKRYCLIDNNEIHFYASKESMEKGQGILESHHIASCEINICRSSLLEWTLQVPCHEILYLKTESYESRRRWLQRLGSAKACMSNTAALIKIKDPGISSPAIANTHNSNGSKKLENDLESRGSVNLVSKSTYDESKNEKRNESDKTDNKNLNSPDQITKAKSELSLVCKELKTELNFIQSTYCNTESEISNSLNKDASKVFLLFTKFSEIVTSLTGRPPEEMGFSEDDTPSESADDRISQHTNDSGFAATLSSISQRSSTQELRVASVPTFFSTVKVSFRDVLSEVKNESVTDLLCNIRTETYIEACVNYTKFFDLFAVTLLGPLKNDVLSNAEKVRKAFAKNPQKYNRIQLIFDDEIANKEHMHPDSATQAVLWMMRGLRTISAFMTHACTPGHPAYRNSASAFDVAYREHLRKYHNFVVQRMFSVGLRFIPNFDHFKNQIVVTNDIDLTSTEVENDIMQQAVAYCQAMSEVVHRIEKVYAHHKIAL